MAKLTDKQQIFVNEYLICWNATEAARRAGYKGNGNTLGVIGFENLRKPKIKAIVGERMAELAMPADEVLLRLGEQARGDIGEFLRFSDGMKLPTIDIEKGKDKTHLIKKLNYKDGSVSFELYDAQAALVHIGRRHGLFTDKMEHSGEVKTQVQYIDIVRPGNDD